jgi:hypothetical protein
MTDKCPTHRAIDMGNGAVRVVPLLVNATDTQTEDERLLIYLDDRLSAANACIRALTEERDRLLQDIKDIYAGHNLVNAEMHERIRELEAQVAALDDDALIERVARDCHDQNHDARWCPTCAARRDGIDSFVEAVKAKLAGD